MNKLFSGTSVAPVPLFLPHNLIHDSFEFVVESFAFICESSGVVL